MDEQKATERFETMCGGANKAAQLFDIFKNSRENPGMGVTRMYAKTREEVFTKKAQEAGFSLKQANALLNLQ